MPKRKKKSKLPKPEKPPIDFELFFTDVTMLATDGNYARVKKVMSGEAPPIAKKQDVPIVGKAFSHGTIMDLRNYSPANDWCIKTRLTIFSPFGEGEYLLDFYHDKNVFIVGYGGLMDPMQNADLRCLSVWCQDNGWKIPQVLPSLARDNINFWKTCWETLLIDSDYFDEAYGTRRSLAMREAEEDEADEDDDELM